MALACDKLTISKQDSWLQRWQIPRNGAQNLLQRKYLVCRAELLRVNSSPVQHRSKVISWRRDIGKWRVIQNRTVLGPLKPLPWGEENYPTFSITHHRGGGWLHLNTRWHCVLVSERIWSKTACGQACCLSSEHLGLSKDPTPARSLATTI